MNEKFRIYTLFFIFFGFLNSFTYAVSPDFYPSCPAVSSCPDETNFKIRYEQTQKRRSELLELSRNYSQRLECFMSEFLETNSPSPGIVCDSHHNTSMPKDILKYTHDHLNYDTYPTSIDPLCFHAASLRGINASSQRFECLHYEQVNPSQPIQYVCAEGHPNCKSNPTQGPCLSKTYSQKLAQVFNRVTSCSGLNLNDKKNLFAIINHESAFMPNARSSTGARCMGQVTGILAKELTARLASGIAGSKSDSHGLEKVLETCPDLHSHTIPKNIEENFVPYVKKYKGGRFYDNALNEIATNPNDRNKLTQAPKEHRRKHFPITCKLVSDPVTCLLYVSTFYRLKSKFFNDILPSNSSFFASNAERQKFKNFVLKISYNGGYAFTSRILQAFLEDVKNCSQNCTFEELSTEYIEYIFSKKEDWLPYRNKQNRCHEVRNYVLKIDEHTNYLTGQDSSIQNHWDRQVGQKIGKPDLFQPFLQEVQNKCSKIIEDTNLDSSRLKELLKNKNLCSKNSST